ncbi:hypothetical protein CP557_17875 [Natrinema ejinorense]|uniref:Uncharacterized protein n=1 Tax=Natrinema ejinorense TaxID=373386 RepID=A0A2A5QZK4_9EURY|nr:hypothetical protein CP557_17875 [Natrinema ejinorense]
MVRSTDRSETSSDGVSRSSGSPTPEGDALEAPGSNADVRSVSEPVAAAPIGTALARRWRRPSRPVLLDPDRSGDRRAGVRQARPVATGARPTAVGSGSPRRRVPSDPLGVSPPREDAACPWVAVPSSADDCDRSGRLGPPDRTPWAVIDARSVDGGEGDPFAVANDRSAGPVRSERPDFVR